MAALQLREFFFRDMLVRFTNVAHTNAASRSMLMKPLGCAWKRASVISTHELSAARTLWSDMLKIAR